MYLRGRRGDRHVTRGYRDVHTLVQPGVEVLRLLPLVTRFLSGTPVGVQKVIILKDNFKLAFPDKFVNNFKLFLKNSQAVILLKN